MTHLVTKNRRFWFTGRLLVLCAATLLSCIGCSLISTFNTAPEPTVKMSSDSPDGKYRCVVKEQLPPKGLNSPHIYTFTIRDSSTDRDLKGEQYQHNTDSVTLTELKFDWAGNELEVSSTDPVRHFLTARVNDDEQQWIPVRN